MYRAIICDDEETVRNGLKKHFDWSGHKIEIVGIFEDGIPAFEYMKTHDVDIIITDVRMIPYGWNYTCAESKCAFYRR